LHCIDVYGWDLKVDLAPGSMGDLNTPFVQNTHPGALLKDQHGLLISQKVGKTTAPRIPAWSPTVVLTRRYSG
jgi:hypothetical protein